MTYKQLIKQWFNRAKKEKDFFTKYIFLYIAFIAFLSQQRVRRTSDREKINEVKRDCEAREYYLRLVGGRSDLRNNLLKLKKELERQPIANVTRDSDNNWRGSDGVLNGVEDWENLVEFWYRVRNNLFHGHKAPEFKRDRVLVTFACSTLLPFM